MTLKPITRRLLAVGFCSLLVLACGASSDEDDGGSAGNSSSTAGGGGMGQGGAGGAGQGGSGQGGSGQGGGSAGGGGQGGSGQGGSGGNGQGGAGQGGGSAGGGGQGGAGQGGAGQGGAGQGGAGPVCGPASFQGLILGPNGWGVGAYCDDVSVCADGTAQPDLMVLFPNMFCENWGQPCQAGQQRCTLNYSGAVTQMQYDSYCDALAISGINTVYCALYP